MYSIDMYVQFSTLSKKVKTYRGMQVYATLWCTNIDFKILPWFPLMIYIQYDQNM